MKKFLLLLLIFLSANVVFALPEDFKIMENSSIVYYSPSLDSWSIESLSDDSLVLNKELLEGTGSYSIYKYSDGNLAFALATGDEFVYDGKLVVVDNNLLKFSKIICENSAFKEIPMERDEIQEMFPEVEIISASWIDEDNKMWIHKPLFKNKTILLLNDTDKFFHSIKTKSKNAQDEHVKGLITISHYGMYRFKHFGERNGRLTFFIR